MALKIRGLAADELYITRVALPFRKLFNAVDVMPDGAPRESLGCSD